MEGGRQRREAGERSVAIMLRGDTTRAKDGRAPTANLGRLAIL